MIPKHLENHKESKNVLFNGENYTKNSFEDQLLIDIIETLVERGEKISIDSCLRESHGLHIANLKQKIKDLELGDNSESICFLQTSP